MTALCAPNGTPLAEALGECDREQRVRMKCFPRWIEDGRVAKMDADDRLRRLEAACYFLKEMLDGKFTPSVKSGEA